MNTVRYVLVCLIMPFLANAAPAPANPWFGQWRLRLADAAEKPETLVYSDAGGGAMRMESVENRSVIVTRFDGEPASDFGTPAGSSRTLAVKATSPTSYRWTFAVAGKPIAQGVNTLAADRRTFTEVSWSPAKPDQTITLVYERQ